MLQAHLITPEQFFLSIDAEMVVVPGVMGDMGIMEQHVPLVSLLRPGVIEIHHKETGSPVERVFVSGGYVETDGKVCTVLAEELIRLADLDKALIMKDLEEARSKLDHAKEPHLVQQSISICEVKLSYLS